jgi:hypothetical protein
MKINIGSKEYILTVKDVFYILGLLGVGCGWFIDAKITKFKNESKIQDQDAKIEAQAEEIRQLKKENQNVQGYAKQNANNIDWIIAIIGLDSK